MFKFSYRPLEFFLSGKFLPKIIVFGNFWGRTATFLKKFGMRVRSWGSLQQAKFCKNCLRGYTPFGQIYTKKYHCW